MELPNSVQKLRSISMSFPFPFLSVLVSTLFHTAFANRGAPLLVCYILYPLILLLGEVIKLVSHVLKSRMVQA